jgi:2-methylisocitrate lyase-like PEP mutase family enzyme
MNRTAFRGRVEAPGLILLPGVANPLAALVAADLGYQALYVTGAGVSNTNLGLPDIGLLGLADITAAVLAIRDVCDLPLVVDADTGFGNAVNVHHTVRRLEAAGANAIQLEDQVFPKKCGHFEGKACIPAAEMTDKIKAAVDARRERDTLIVARTDARAVEGFEAALDRARAYAEAGADVLFVEALTTHAEMLQAPAALPRPLLMNIVFGGKTPPMPGADLEAAGYRFALYANAALQAALWAMQHVLGSLKATGSLDGMQQYLAPFAERQRLVRKQDYDSLERRFTQGAG